MCIIIGVLRPDAGSITVDDEPLGADCRANVGRIWHEVFLVDPLAPLVPELFESETCDVPATVQLPEQAGIEHTGEEAGHIRTVTATIDDSLIARPDVELDP